MASERLSRSRPLGATRWLIFFGLALATPRVYGAAPTEWPVKKDADYGHVSVKNFDDSTSGGHLKIETGAGTTIKAASASTGGDIFANGYTATADGISARLKTVEDRLAQLRDDFDDTSVAELTDLHDKCTSVHTSLSAKIDALETDINSTAFTPPECSDDTSMRGIVRIDGAWVCMCKKNYTTGTGAAQSDYGACDVSPCALPNDFLSDANVVQNCAETHLKEGATCTFSCKDYYRPDAAATQGIDGELTCASGTATGSTHCVVCTDNYSGPNCEKQSCDLGVAGTAGTYFGDSLVTDVDCNSQYGRYLNASYGCDYDCAANYMPYDLAPTDSTTSPADSNINKAGTVTCGDGDGQFSGGPNANGEFCVACNNAYSGVNCKLKSCDLSTLTNDNNYAAVANTGDQCPDYLKATLNCKYDCADGYMPSAASTTVATSGTITCAASGDGTTTPSTPTCVACNTQLPSSDQNRTGVNCATAACDVPATARANDNDHTCGTKLKVGDSCSFKCPNDKMPSGGTAGQAGTVTCGTGSTVSGQSTCVACEGQYSQYSGNNCETPPCDLTAFGYIVPETADSKVVSSTCGLNSGELKAGASCEYSCSNGYMPNTLTVNNAARRIDCTKTAATTVRTDSGTSTSPATDVVTATSQLTCVACDTVTGFTDYTGINCQTPSCQMSSLLIDLTNVIDSTCGNTMKAGGTCTYSCSDGSMPRGLTTTGQSQTLSCAPGGTTVTGTGYTSAASACIACATASSAFTNYTGDNCQTQSCLVNTVLSDDTNVIDSTCGTSMKAGDTCEYSCENSMPTGLNQASATGQARTLTCATGGSTITATGAGVTAASACTACTGGRTGKNCETAPS